MSPTNLFLYLRTECPLIFNRCNITADEAKVLLDDLKEAQDEGSSLVSDTDLLLLFKFLERIVEGSLIITKDIVEAFVYSGMHIGYFYEHFCDDDPFYEIVTEEEAMKIIGCEDKQTFREKYKRLCTPFKKEGIGVHYLRQHIELLKEVVVG